MGYSATIRNKTRQSAKTRRRIGALPLPAAVGLVSELPFYRMAARFESRNLKNLALFAFPLTSYPLKRYTLTEYNMSVARKAKLVSRASKVAALTAAGLPQAKIAETVGVCRQTVAKLQQTIKPEIDEIANQLDAYRSSILKGLPIDYRISTIKRLTESDSDQVALNALQYADKVTFGAAISGDDKDRSPEMTPLFSLPAGSKVAIVVGDGNKDKR